MQDTIIVAVNNLLTNFWSTALPVCVSAIALAVSLVALWKTHFSKFKPIFVVGDLNFRIYPIKNRKDRWFIPSVAIPFTVANNGVQPGIIRALRVVIRYPQVPIPKHYEVFIPKFEINPATITLLSKNRFDWIDRYANDWMPFVVLSKTVLTKVIVFESKWDDSVIQSEIEFALEVLYDTQDKWIEIDGWMLSLSKSTWVEMTSRGTSFSTTSIKHPIAIFRETQPDDLHKYTSTKDDLSEVKLESAPSYLDFPDNESDR